MTRLQARLAGFQSFLLENINPGVETTLSWWSQLFSLSLQPVGDLLISFEHGDIKDHNSCSYSPIPLWLFLLSSEPIVTFPKFILDLLYASRCSHLFYFFIYFYKCPGHFPPSLSENVCA